MTNTNTIETTATVSEAPAVENGAVLFVPLGKLKKSPRNARKTPHSEAHIEALAASIANKGMLQNLVVEPETNAEGEPTGFYFVTIGEGRRLAQLLRVKRKQIKKSEAIRCVLVINSNLRTYHMELRSTEKTYMASVSWQYPQDQLIALRRQNQQAEAAQPVASGLDLTNVNFRYEVSGDRAPWRPLRAFDDGRQVFIEFPRGIAQGEMPPLFVVRPEGDTSELVNYRVRGNYMIVDRLFAAAELRFGAAKDQKRVRISRTDGRPAS